MSIFDREVKREEWVSTLQAGDRVAIKFNGWGRIWGIYEVEKVTPSGRRNLSHGVIVNPDGSIRGDSYNYANPVTEEIMATIWRERAIVKIERELLIRELSNDNLNRILQVLKDHEEKHS